ncbi:MAG: acyl dehydratase [Deltaproteobacteria bacterium]|nr:acyl dehydratase [Deltaproteobacteria bacterium]
MDKWEKQLFYEDVKIGSETHEVALPISLQLLVMEAGANRDLSSIHHDNEAGIATGASSAYANTYFLMGMIERLLREWMGIQGKLKKISSLRMKIFNSVGDVVRFTGKVTEKDDANAAVVLDICSKTDKGETMTAEATVILPKKED